jgi:hypothetical protein
MNAQHKTAGIGSIICGTHNSQHLARVFADSLEALANANQRVGYHANLINDLRRLARGDTEQMDMADDIIAEGMDALSEFAMPYTYFGTHPGDGADYGFWPDFDTIADDVRAGELMEVSDPCDVPAKGMAVFVNDHGNTSIYRDGILIWDVV